MKPPRIGSFRDRIVIKSKTETRSDTGAVKYTTSTVVTDWGSIEPINGREYWEAQQVAAELKVRIRMRRTSDTDAITPKMWAEHDSIVYDIDSVVNVENRNREIHLMCTRRL